MSDRRVTWWEGGVRNVGARQTGRACVVVHCWAMCRLSIGHEPKVAEYSDFWGLSLSQAYREVALVRKAFGPVCSPWRITESAIDQGLTSEAALRKLAEKLEGAPKREALRDEMEREPAVAVYGLAAT